MGRPVIASRIGGLSDIVADGISGLLIPPGDVDALSAAIQDLLADPARRNRMGRAAQQRVVAFQARTVVPRIEQVYRELLHPQPPQIEGFQQQSEAGRNFVYGRGGPCGRPGTRKVVEPD